METEIITIEDVKADAAKIAAAAEILDSGVIGEHIGPGYVTPIAPSYPPLLIQSFRILREN